MRHRIGKARPVNVQPQPVAFRAGSNRGHLRGLVNPAVFACLGDRDRLRLDLMHILADAGDGSVDCRGGDSGAITIDQDQFGAVSIEPRRAAFVGFDMRLAVADHPAMRGHHAGQREAVGGGSGGDPHHRAGPPEQRAERRVQRQAQRVVVIRRLRRIGGAQRIPHGGVDAGGIVGQELHRRAACGREVPASS